MKLYGLQALQILGMIATPFVIGMHASSKETIAVWSCVVIALLFIGISICSLGNLISERDAKAKGPKWTQ
jgi:hypothetical protein